MERCFNLKQTHRDDQPLPPHSSKCKIMITGLKKAMNTALSLPEKTNPDNL
jgi:hypothetical protein